MLIDVSNRASTNNRKSRIIEKSQSDDKKTFVTYEHLIFRALGGEVNMQIIQLLNGSIGGDRDRRNKEKEGDKFSILVTCASDSDGWFCFKYCEWSN